ncbi:acyltransferase family protein [Lacisediminihabitans sp.]|uniref:acyltransferase family protein n=1 Tax=Lacisediminihabitans sp. TaxID=2787631 RepID=UPI00374D5F1D
MNTLAATFDPRGNSIGFIRWLMAFLVIFSHAGPIGGFYGGHDLGTQWSDEQSLGGVAVGGFFFFSGFLITKSRMGRSSLLRFFWRRVLRIFPAFWVALLVTAFVLAPIAWMHRVGPLSGYFSSSTESPLTYFSNNMFLLLGQRNIAGLGQQLPYFQLLGSRDWNGSAWTLSYEFSAYIAVGVLGLIGALVNRKIGAAIAVALIALSTLQWLRIGDLSAALPLFHDIYILLLLPPFAFGILFALYADKIPLDGRLAIGLLAFAVLTYGKGGWLVFGQYAFYYFLMWFATRVTILKNWERFGDFSYGIYIFAWPIMTLVAYYGLQNQGWLVYHLVVVVLCHVAAFLSWHLIEKPAMSLKDWTPRPLSQALDKLTPANEWLVGVTRRAAAVIMPAKPAASSSPAKGADQ